MTAQTGAGSPIAVSDWPRVAVRLVLLATWLVVCLFAHALCAPFARHNPVPPRFLAGAAFVAGLRTRRIGERPAPGSMLLANHVSWLDICALAGATRTAFVAHDGLAAFGPLRILCELNRTVFIARGERGTVSAQVAQVREALARNRALTIFPEGTTSFGTGVLPFKSSLLSALEAGGETIPVHPVWLDYGPDVAQMAWSGDEPGRDNFLRILARTAPLHLSIHVLPALEGEDRGSRKAIARAAHAAIAKVMAETRGDAAPGDG